MFVCLPFILVKRTSLNKDKIGHLLNINDNKQKGKHIFYKPVAYKNTASQSKSMQLG